MKRGTKVGQAYVALTVDGDGVNDDIENAVGDVDTKKTGKKLGKDLGDEAGPEFNKSMEKSISDAVDRLSKKLSTNLSRNLNKGLKEGLDNQQNELSSSIDKLGTKLSRNLSLNVKKGLKQAFGEAGEELVNTLANVVHDIENKVGGAGGGRGSGGGSGGGSGAGGVSGNSGGGTSRALFKKSDVDVVSRLLETVEKNRLKAHEDSNLAILKDDQARAKDRVALDKKNAGILAKIEKEVWAVRNATAKAHFKYLSELEKGSIDERGNTIRKLKALDRDSNKIGDKIGALFGAGSRNNALNLFGKSIGGVINLLDGAGAASKKLFTNFGEGFHNAEADANKFQRVIAGFRNIGGGGSGGGGLLNAIPGALGGIIAVTAAVSVLTSVLSALTGVVIALAASISGALIGALGGAVGLLLPLAAIIGTVVVGIKGLNKESKAAFSEGVRPLLDSLRGVAQVVSGKLFNGGGLGKTIGELVSVVKLPEVRKILEQVSVAVRQIAENFVYVAKGPGVKNLLQVLGGNGLLAENVKLLGRVFNDLFFTVAGIFTGLQPLVNQFLVYFSGVTKTFREFINSVEGQNKVAAFFDRMGESARVVFRFIGAVVKIIGKLFSAGQNTGDSIFNSMTTALQNFLGFVSTDNRLENFFASAKTLADALGDTIVILGIVLADLSKSGVISFLERFIGGLREVVEFLDRLPGSTGAAIIGVAAFSGAVLLATRRLVAMGIAAEAGTIAPLGRLGTAVTGAASKLSLLKGVGIAAGIYAVADSANRGSKALGGLEGALGGAVAGGLAFGVPGALIGGAGGYLYGIFSNGTKAKEAVDALGRTAAQQAPSLQALADSLNQVNGAATKATVQVSTQLLQQAKLFPAIDRLGLSYDLVAKAAGGNLQAQQQLSASLDPILEKYNALVIRGSNVFVGNKYIGLTTDKNVRSFFALGAAATHLSAGLGQIQKDLHTTSTEVLRASLASGALSTVLGSLPSKKIIQIIQSGVSNPSGAIAQIVKLNALYKLTPKQIITLLTASGIPQVAAQLDYIRRLADYSSRPRTLLISILYNKPVAPVPKGTSGQFVLDSQHGGLGGVPPIAGTPKPPRGGGVPSIPATPSVPKGGGSRGAAGRSKADIRKALAGIYRSVGDALQEAAKASDAKAVQDNFKNLIRSLNDTADGLTKVAKKKVKAVTTLIKRQEISSAGDIAALVKGEKVKNATLASIAQARFIVAAKLQKATDLLQERTALRDDYKKQVTDAVKSFGDLTTAVAKTINGVEQALTSADITSNLQDRLAKIKKFQDNLRILVAQGLSQDAYKSIIDQGVEAGSVFTDALIAGGPGSIGQINDLTGQITKIADTLGTETSNRLYQAGVNAAQGLVDGLTSLSKQLDAAATRLGNSIAAAVKKSLGIKSPSLVMIDAMGYVGDGLEQGLDAQHTQVGRAAGRLANQIHVSPEVASYANQQGKAATVSGNQDMRPIDLHVHTPTKDPKAAGIEAINELVGRL